MADSLWADPEPRSSWPWTTAPELPADPLALKVDGPVDELLLPLHPYTTAATSPKMTSNAHTWIFRRMGSPPFVDHQQIESEPADAR